MNLDKYLWKNRLILVETTSYQNDKYIEAKKIFIKNIKKFSKRYVKFISYRNKDNKFKIKLIGFDGEVKKTFSSLNPEKIFNLIDKMPLGQIMKD